MAAPKLYADLPVRRALQVAGDLALVVWVVVWIRIGDTVHDATLGLAKPGRQINDSATGLAGQLRSAGRKVSQVPFVGDDVRKPFDGAGSAAARIAAAGRSQVDAVQTLAFWLGLAVMLIPILIALYQWLPRRIAFVLTATAGQRLLDSGEDLDLFALRAMSNQPLHVLARVSTDPAGAWRRREPATVRRMAEIELRASGLRVPPEAVLGRSGPDVR